MSGYGPDATPDDAVGWVRVRHNSKRVERVEVPLPPALVRQRRQLNALAASAPGTGGAL